MISRRNSTVALASIALAAMFAVAPAQAQDAPKVKLATSMGDIVVQLDAAKAPKTVENFLAYVNSKHYDGTIFHRVIDGFMIQGGGMETGLTQKATRAPIANEAGNGLKNKRYTVAMARTNEPLRRRLRSCSTRTIQRAAFEPTTRPSTACANG